MKNKRTILLLMLFVSIMSCLSLDDRTYSVRSPEGRYFKIQTPKAAFSYAHRVAKYQVEDAWGELIELGMRGAVWNDDDFQRIVASGMKLVDKALQDANALEIERTKYFFSGGTFGTRIVHIQNAINNIEDVATLLKRDMNKYIDSVRLKFSLRSRNIKKY